jgi:mono/diheme cytochrome c family protein
MCFLPSQLVSRLRHRIPNFLFFIALAISAGVTHAQDGKSLFQTNCAQCHNPIQVVVGPALKGVTQRVTDSNLLHAWIRNNVKVLATGNTYFTNLYNQYGRAPMNTFPGLSDKEIDAILNYVENYAQPIAATNTSDFPNAAQEDHTVLYGIVTFILAVFVFGLYLVNGSLKKLAEEQKGIPQTAPIPVYRNKIYITAFLMILFCAFGWWLTSLGIGLGRMQGYQPEQPIFFSHRVHAGLNQISCLLCHGNAWESKQASVPSLNFCMNCHAAITVYKGERLQRENQTRVDPNEEIQKLFSYTGYDPSKGKYTRQGRPIEWIKIHNLPDHVFFSHAQHVHVGKVQCQTCHGPVQEMDEVRQFAPLSMGWCINCHRSTAVNFPDSVAGRQGNKFYNIYPRFTNELKNHDKDSVTVQDIGGTECQKCHY